MIDIHCHILPEVDDGPKSWEVAVEMCRMAAADGITHTVATPHANHRYAYERTYLLELLDELRGRVGPTPEFSLGCDFHLSFENLERVLAEPHTYTIGDTNYLLIELSNYSIPAQLGMFCAPGRPRADADSDASGAQSDSSAIAATRARVCRAGLPDSGDGFVADRVLG